MSNLHKLNDDHKAQLYDWLGDGYTNPQIQKAMADERGRGIRYDEELWPELTDKTLSYYRTRIEIPSSAHQAVSAVSGTAIGSKMAQLRRMAKVIGDHERTIQRLMDEVEALLAIDIAATQQTVRAGTIDVGDTRLPAASFIDTVALAEDPLGERKKQALDALAKHLAVWNQTMTTVARISGTMNSKPASDDKAEDHQEKLKRAEAFVERFRVAYPGRAG